MNNLTKPSKTFSWIRNLYHLDPTVVGVLFCLAVVNILVQFSANNRVFQHLISDILYLVISFGLLFIVANLNVGHLRQIAIPAYIISIILLIAVMIIGVKINGAKRWLNLGIRVQPSELCKLSVPLLVAYYMSLKEEAPRLIDYGISGLLILIPIILIAKQPDLGTSVLVLSSGFFVLFFAGLSWRIIIVGVILVCSIAPIGWHVLHDYQKHRIMTLFDPQSDPLGAGYHIIQGIIAIGSGGFYGKGYLHGTQIHLDFIPEKNTDFVITVLAEEFGYLGVCIVLILYLILALRGLKIVMHATDLFSKTLAGSIVLSFVLYVLINMGMVAGVFPVVGVPLPFISYGGTATIVLMIGFGVLLAIKKQNDY